MIHAEELRALDAFRDLVPEQCARVLCLLSERVVSKGDVLFREGEDGDAAYLILDGVVRVLCRGSNGSSHVLANIRAGWVVGEMALLDGGPRSATVECLGGTRVARLAATDFDILVREHPDIACHVLRRIGRMLSLRLRRMSSLCT